MRTHEDVFECGDVLLQRGGTLRKARIESGAENVMELDAAAF